MERYHQRPLDSHPGTFDWLFDSQSRVHACDCCTWSPGMCCSQQHCKETERDLRKHASRLQTWLETSDDIFWVRGKAGSVKSTFMKFLFEHEQTRIHLRKWANGDVIVAGFFFWSAGSSELEKSYLGLLRGLLHQVLRERPSLIELVFPARWEAVVRSTTYKRPWTKSELLTALELLQASATDARFCFLLDGLDEFEDDHRDLIDAVQRLSESPMIKICVSSRPWYLFQQSFGSDDRLNVALHELTQRDIDVYITTRLETFPLTSLHHTELRQLGNAVRERSEGVFLWVTLAVRDLRRGIGEHDSITMLQERLERYPFELQDLFQHIFDKIDLSYKRCTGRLLLMLLAPPLCRDLAFIGVPFLEHFAADGSLSIDTRWSPKNCSEMHKLMDQAILCINKWCRGILQPIDEEEVHRRCVLYSCNQGDLMLLFCNPGQSYGLEGTRSFLSFGHQTIHQFVKQKAEDGTLFEMAGFNFEPYQAWLYTYIGLLKYVLDLPTFVIIATEALCLVAHEQHPSTWSISRSEDDAVDYIHQCLVALDQTGQNIPRPPQWSHWTCGQIVQRIGDNNVISQCTSTEQCSSLVSYLLSLSPRFTHAVNLVINRLSKSLTDGQKQFVIETALVPHIYEWPRNFAPK